MDTSGSVARGLGATLIVPSRRVGLEVLDHGSGQVPVGGNVVALYYLAGLWVLVVAGPHEGIVAQVAADVGGDDLAVDAIAGDKVLVLAGGGRGDRRALVAGLSRHGDDASVGRSEAASVSLVMGTRW
jgi:hypothetical protein